MEKLPIYTIGYGNRKPEAFIALLKQYKIQYIVDVRSVPYAKFNITFTQDILKIFLEQQTFTYLYMGDTLGGMPKDPTCYDENGKVNDEAIKSKDGFKKSIERLKLAYEKNLGIALMCAEANPCGCHRSRLIGNVLIKENIPLQHINEQGNLKSQIAVMNEFYKGFPEVDLFGNIK